MKIYLSKKWNKNMKQDNSNPVFILIDKTHIPVYDYRKYHNGNKVSLKIINKTDKFIGTGVHGNSRIVKLTNTPCIGDFGLHCGIMVHNCKKPKIIYH